MKQKLLNLWLLAVMMIVGSSGAWAETTTVGKTDFTSGWWSAFSPYYTFNAGQKLHLEFTNNTCDDALCVANGWGDPAGWKNFFNYVLVISNDVDRDSEGYVEYAALRPDNYGWGTKYDETKNYSNWNWDNFQAVMNGANVTLEIIRNGAIVDVKMMVVGGDGNDYFQNYSFDSGDAENKFRAFLTVEHAYINIDDSKTQIVGGTAILPLAGHLQVSGISIYEGMPLTKVYLNSYSNTINSANGGAFALKFLLDQGFDPTLIKSAKLNMHINGKPNKKRTSTVTFRPQASDPTPTSSINDTKTSVDGNARVVSQGTIQTKRWVWTNSPTVTDSWSSQTNSYPKNGTVISIDVTKLIKSFTTKKAGDEIWISADVNDVATDTYVDAYGSENPPTLEIEYSNEPLAAYVLKGVCGNTDLGELASDVYVVGQECTVEGLSKVVKKDGKCYVLDQEQTGVSGYNYTFVKAAEDETLTIAYVFDEKMEYFGEVESLGNATSLSEGNYSGGKYAAIAGGKAASLTTLRPGKYKASAYLVDQGNRGVFFRNSGVADNTENVIVNCGTNKNSTPGEYTTEEFTLTESTAVTLTGYTSSDGKTNQSAGLDYVYFTRNANLVLPGYYGKAAELTGNVNDDYSITLNGSTLTVSTRKPGYGFQKIKLFTSKFDGVTVSEGRLDDKAVWTGDAEEVVFTLNGSTVNAIAINDAEIPTASVVNNISAFKATDAQSGMKLINADVRAITDEGTVIEDDGAGILLKGIFIPGAAVGKRLTGTIIGIYDPAKRAMVSTELTDCTTPVVNTISGRGAREISNAEALTDVNSFRLVKLNALTIDNGGASVTDNSNNTVKLDNTLFADMATLIGNATSMVSLTGVVYYNGTENVLMPRSASDIVLGSIEQSFADGKAYNPGDEIASSTGVVMTFGGEKSDENVYKFETLDAPVNGYTTGTAGISEGTSYQFDALRNGTLVVTVALEAGKKLSVVCDGEELENDSYQFNGNVITLPVETGKTYIISAVDSNLGLMGYEYQVSDLSAPAVAKNISVFRNMVYGTEAKLMLNDAVVTYIKGDNVFVEDASGAIDFYETQVQFYVGQKLNGYIIGENNVQDNMPVLLRTAATPTSKFTAEKGTAQSKVATVAEALQENNLARFVTLKNLKQAKDKRGFRILIDEVGDTIYIEDRFNVLYEMGNRYSRIEGIIGINAEGTCCIWPTSKDGVVIAGEPATFETGKYYLSNVGATLADENAVWGAGNSWGTQASLVKHPEYVTLHKIADGTYQMETQVSNGGTKYFFNDDNNGNFYMDNGTPTTLTISQSKEPVGYADDEETKPIYGYYIANGESCYGWDGTTTVLAKGIDQSSNNALWIIASEEQAVASLAEAKADNPVDATFLILDPNFGRNNRNQSAWTVSEDCTNKNLSGGNNTNNCAESYMSVFTISQTIDVPNGKYVLNAQAAVTFHDNREIKEYDGNGYPQIFANDKVSNFNDMIVEDRLSNMGKLSEQFTAGMYTVEPIEVIVTDGKLTIGAKSERADIWAIWDNFELTYYGPANADGVLLQLDFENGEAADYWQKGVGYLVTPEFEGTTGQAASIKSGSDRGDYILTEANYAGVEDYNIDLDFAICKGSKTAFFAVMSESSWIFTYTWNNWGYFWKTTTTSDGQVHNPYLFELTIPSGTTAYINEQYDAQETGLANVNGGTWEFTEKNWYHLSLKVKADTKTVGYTVTDKATGAQALNGTYTMRDGESIYMKGIYERNNRVNADPGAILFDNIVVSTGNGPVTAIETVNAETTVRFAEGVYNLRGQKVGDSLQGLPKGLYIVNGKKVVVK